MRYIVEVFAPPYERYQLHADTLSEARKLQRQYGGSMLAAIFDTDIRRYVK